MKTLFGLLILFTLSLPALANPPAVNKTEAEAQGDTRRPVVVKVTVQNRGKEASSPAVVAVEFTPKTRGGGGDTLKDHMTVRQMVGPLQPNEMKVLEFQTPYESRNSFRGQRGTFRAVNIDPTGEVTVGFKASAAPAPTR